VLVSVVVQFRSGRSRRPQLLAPTATAISFALLAGCGGHAAATHKSLSSSVSPGAPRNASSVAGSPSTDSGPSGTPPAPTSAADMARVRAVAVYLGMWKELRDGRTHVGLEIARAGSPCDR
jgi:hypothetical protein